MRAGLRFASHETIRPWELSAPSLTSYSVDANAALPSPNPILFARYRTVSRMTSRAYAMPLT